MGGELVIRCDTLITPLNANKVRVRGASERRWSIRGLDALSSDDLTKVVRDETHRVLDCRRQLPWDRGEAPAPSSTGLFRRMRRPTSSRKEG